MLATTIEENNIESIGEKVNTATITLHDTDNCGSSLQAYALQYFLLKNNINNVIIDYVPIYLKNNGNPLKTIIRKIVFWKKIKEREKKFQEFKKNYLVVTDKKYSTLSELEQMEVKVDCYITGSDQLWNEMYPCGRDPAYYLEFVKGHKIAYAISVAREIIPNSNLKIIKKYAKDFDWVSTRELAAVEQLNNLHISFGDVDYVCDPVMLNPIGVYNEIRGDRIINRKYIMVYLAQDIDVELLKLLLTKIDNRHEYQIVSVGSYRSKFSSDYHISTMSPSEFLSLIYYAEFVVSNSFHATVFSLMYKKQFYTILPERNSVRINDLLKMTNLEQYAITKDRNIVDEIISDEKYQLVQQILKSYSKKSGDLLLEHLHNIGEGVGTYETL